MRNRFDNQLLLLNSELITMGALCEESISYAIEYLTAPSKAIWDSTIEVEKQIDRKERDIESLCMRLLMQQQPVARDLRTISSALKMISDMERIGDQSADIVEVAKYVTLSSVSSRLHISDMAMVTSRMVTDSVESFVKKDTQIAYESIALDDTVDGLFLKVKGELIKAIQSGNDDAETLIDLLMVAKYFERIGDHAVNIAEWVIYSITGRHK